MTVVVMEDDVDDVFGNGGRWLRCGLWCVLLGTRSCVCVVGGSSSGLVVVFGIGVDVEVRVAVVWGFACVRDSPTIMVIGIYEHHNTMRLEARDLLDVLYWLTHRYHVDSSESCVLMGNTMVSGLLEPSVVVAGFVRG